jgi:hypothetical protein
MLVRRWVGWGRVVSVIGITGCGDGGGRRVDPSGSPVASSKSPPDFKLVAIKTVAIPDASTDETCKFGTIDGKPYKPDPAFEVIRIHLENGLFEALESTGDICGNAVGTSDYCTSVVPAYPQCKRADSCTKEDDNWGTSSESGVSLFPKIPISSPPTQLDVDLTTEFHKALAAGKSAILLKIMLDDPNFEFIPSGSKDASDNAVLAGNDQLEDNTMVSCRQPIVSYQSASSPPTNLQYVVVRVNYKHVRIGQVGGLSIGIRRKGSTTTLPIFIDPQIKNDG